MSFEIRAMSLGEILDMGFRLLRAHFKTLVGLGLIGSIPTALASHLSTSLSTNPDTVAIVSVIVLVFFFIVASPIVSAAITHAISEVYLGRSATLGGSIGVGLKMFLPLIGTSFLMFLMVGIGFLLLVIPGIYLMFAFLLIWQVMVIEKRAGWDALKRTRELSSGSLLRIFAVYFVGLLVMSVISTGLSFATMSIPILALVVSALTQAIMTAYLAATLVVLYFDIRCRKEAFDLEHLAGVVGEQGAAAATPL